MLRCKEFLDFGDYLHELIDLVGSIVEVEAGASGGFDPELPHQGLIAVVATAQRDPSLIGQSDHIMRVHLR
jgi:hypothetical protein